MKPAVRSTGEQLTRLRPFLGPSCQLSHARDPAVAEETMEQQQRRPLAGPFLCDAELVEHPQIGAADLLRIERQIGAVPVSKLTP